MNGNVAQDVASLLLRGRTELASAEHWIVGRTIEGLHGIKPHLYAGAGGATDVRLPGSKFPWFDATSGK